MKDTKPEKQRPHHGHYYSIIIACFWSYNHSGEPHQGGDNSQVPVQLLNVQSLTARQLAIAGDGEYTVDVVVEGRRADIAKIPAKTS